MRERGKIASTLFLGPLLLSAPAAFGAAPTLTGGAWPALAEAESLRGAGVRSAGGEPVGAASIDLDSGRMAYPT